jgi:hypothetical protein
MKLSAIVTARAVFHCRTTICDSIGGADVDWHTSIPLNFLPKFQIWSRIN